MAEIGEPIRRIIVVPEEQPIEKPAPAPAPERKPLKEPAEAE
jgi:hypothetical protein